MGDLPMATTPDSAAGAGSKRPRVLFPAPGEEPDDGDAADEDEDASAAAASEEPLEENHPGGYTFCTKLCLRRLTVGYGPKKRLGEFCKPRWRRWR